MTKINQEPRPHFDFGHSPGNQGIFCRPHARGLLSESWIPGTPRVREAWAATVSPGKENPERYKVYIFKVPKQVHPGVSVGAKDMFIVNPFTNDIFEKLAGSAPATCGARRASPGNVQKPTPGSVSPSSREAPTPGTERHQRRALPSRGGDVTSEAPLGRHSLMVRRLPRGRRRHAAPLGGCGSHASRQSGLEEAQQRVFGACPACAVSSDACSVVPVVTP